jgi:ATPase subunit of ABC transporter with duplicated ATPase domains
VTGVLDQRRTAYHGAEPLLATFVARTGVRPGEARTLLAKFNLGAEQVSRRCETLSPGERTRAQLAELMARGVNLLVLDEPTNHLDLEAIEELETALGAYDGTLVVVSHDRRFLEAVAPTRSIRL